MSYLYGDSSPSDLKINFVEFLRDALDFSVQAVLADRRIREGAERALEHRRKSEGEVTRLETLGAAIARAIDAVPLGDPDSPAARCAGTVLKTSADLVLADIDRVRANLSAELAKIDAQAGRERDLGVQALSALLVRQELPDWSVELRFEQSGERYLARLGAKTGFGLETAFELEIPAGHLMAHVVRVDKLVERLEVQAPEAGGWLRKEVKLRPQRLDKEYVSELKLGAQETTIKLRPNADGSGGGFDLILRSAAPRAQLVRAGDADQTPFELAEADQARVLELESKLVTACAELAAARKVLLEATLDGKSLREHPEPRAVVVRLIETIAPVVQEIARRSTPAELVLKRQLANGRREEIFVARDELKQKLSPLTDDERRLFAPLGLAESPSRSAKNEAAPLSSAPLPPATARATPVAAAGPPPAPPRSRRPTPAAAISSATPEADEVAELLLEGPLPDLSGSSLRSTRHAETK